VPLQLKDVGKEFHTFTWHFLGEDIEVTYNLYTYTAEFEEELREMVGDGDFASEGIIASVLKLVTAWEVYDGEEKVPLTPEALSKVPIRLLGDLMEAVRDDAGGDEEEGKSSGGRSLPNRASRRHPGGTSSKQQGSFA
jgi:hypothetical protein